MSPVRRTGARACGVDAPSDTRAIAGVPARRARNVVPRSPKCQPRSVARERCDDVAAVLLRGPLRRPYTHRERTPARPVSCRPTGEPYSRLSGLVPGRCEFPFCQGNLKRPHRTPPYMGGHDHRGTTAEAGTLRLQGQDSGPGPDSVLGPAERRPRGARGPGVPGDGRPRALPLRRQRAQAGRRLRRGALPLRRRDGGLRPGRGALGGGGLQPRRLPGAPGASG
jgi:hypothetical protein